MPIWIWRIILNINHFFLFSGKLLKLANVISNIRLRVWRIGCQKLMEDVFRRLSGTLCGDTSPRSRERLRTRVSRRMTSTRSRTTSPPSDSRWSRSWGPRGWTPRAPPAPQVSTVQYSTIVQNSTSYILSRRIILFTFFNLPLALLWQIRWLLSMNKMDVQIKLWGIRFIFLKLPFWRFDTYLSYQQREIKLTPWI